MATLTQHLTLDVAGTCLPVYKYIKQNDGDSTWLTVTIVANGTQLIPASGDTAAIRVSKPDGTMANNPATINNDGTVTALITKQMTAVPGIAKADICLIGPDNEIISTAPFFLDVDKMPGIEGIPSTNEFLYLLEILDDVEQAKEDAENARDEAVAAVGDIDFRTSGNYIQYTNDGGTTWKNLCLLSAVIGGPIGQARIDELWP